MLLRVLPKAAGLMTGKSKISAQPCLRKARSLLPAGFVPYGAFPGVLKKSVIMRAGLDRNLGDGARIRRPPSKSTNSYEFTFSPFFSEISGQQLFLRSWHGYAGLGFPGKQSCC